MKLPLVSRKKYEKMVKTAGEHNLANRVLATKLKRIQDLCEDHTNKKMGNLRFCTIIKQVVDKK